MEKWIGTGVACVALVVGIWNIIAIQGVANQVDAIEIAAVAQVEDAPREERRRDRRRASRDERPGSESLATVRSEDRPRPEVEELDLDDPVIVDQLTARLEERLEQRHESEREARHQSHIDDVTDELHRFAADRGWSDTTTAEVADEVAVRMESWSAMRDDMRSGALSRFEGRREMDAMREESDAKIEALVGAEDAAALDETLWGGDRGRGGRGRRR